MPVWICARVKIIIVIIKDSHMNKTPNKTQNSGFTLLEILVVMVIIGILVTIGVNTFMGAQKKGRDSRRKEDLHQITTALEVYYNDHGYYPESSGNGEIIGCGGSGPPSVCNWGAIFARDNITYMVQLPKDPVDGRQYYYDSDDGRDYAIFAYLENDQDGVLVKDEDGQVLFYEGMDCGGSTLCSYGLSSTNRSLVPEVDATTAHDDSEDASETPPTSPPASPTPPPTRTPPGSPIPVEPGGPGLPIDPGT